MVHRHYVKLSFTCPLRTLYGGLPSPVVAVETFYRKNCRTVTMMLSVIRPAAGA